MSNLEPLARLETNLVKHTLEGLRDERAELGGELQLDGFAEYLESDRSQTRHVSR